MPADGLALLVAGASVGTDMTHIFMTPGPRFNIKMSSYQYRKSHCEDKTVVRSSYLHNGISYTGKMTSLYWIRALPLNGLLWYKWYSVNPWCLVDLFISVYLGLQNLFQCVHKIINSFSEFKYDYEINLQEVCTDHIWYCQTSNISWTLLGNKIVDHSDVGASTVGAAPTTSLFST